VVFEELSEKKKQMVADTPATSGPHNLEAPAQGEDVK
jgi:hypothetical protein